MEVVNKLTGEVYEIKFGNPSELAESWRLLSETIKACERAKDKLKPHVSKLLATDDTFQVGDYQFRQLITQRQTYDKAIMRQELDADLYDLLVMPNKTEVDKYIRDNLTDLGDSATKLRKSMIAVGEPYITIRLEKMK